MLHMLPDCFKCSTTRPVSPSPWSSSSNFSPLECVDSLFLFFNSFQSRLFWCFLRTASLYLASFPPFFLVCLCLRHQPQHVFEKLSAPSPARLLVRPSIRRPHRQGPQCDLPAPLCLLDDPAVLPGADGPVGSSPHDCIHSVGDLHHAVLDGRRGQPAHCVWTAERG